MRQLTLDYYFYKKHGSLNTMQFQTDVVFENDHNYYSLLQ